MANNATCVQTADAAAATTRNKDGYTPEEREQILRAYHERSSLRGLTRTFGVARKTVSGWLKKSS